VGPAWAHKVTIFAWVEGDMVHTQSKFSRGRPAKNSIIVVYDKEGNQLLEGRTDEQGEFSFEVPKKTDLKVALKASMGHLAEWNISAEEITGAAPASEGTTSSKGERKVDTQGAVPIGRPEISGHQPIATTTGGLSPEEIKILIDQAMDKKLAPITNMLTESLGRGPKVSDVVGGLGYIVGLVGVALYVTNRRKRG
jgi:nickel transport protein